MNSPVSSSRNADSLQKFQRDVSRLLTDQDRDYLHDVLKDFYSGRSVERLVSSLKSCLDTPKKMDLLVDIRNLLPANYRSKFDSLAPYNFMSKPFRPPSLSNSQKSGSSHPFRSKTNGSFCVVNLQKSDPDASLGFSIRGGREYGTGVYISTIDENTMARKEGLKIGDQIIECNGMDFEHITHTSAVKLLSSITKVKLVVKSEGRLPEFNEVKAGFSWMDANGLPVEDSLNDTDDSDKESIDQHIPDFQSNIKLLHSIDEKRIDFTINELSDGFIGFNLRGGKEYGLGIYVSRVDKDSVVEQAGLQVGDLILDVNGTSFESISHQAAVDFMKSQHRVIMRVKSTGILPAAKLIYSDVSWVYPDGAEANVSQEMKQNMSMLQVPVPCSLNTSHRDSSIQVDLLGSSPSPTPSLSRSDIGIQATPLDEGTQEAMNTSLPSQTTTDLEQTPVSAVEASDDQTFSHIFEPSPYEAMQSASSYVNSENTKTARLKGGDEESGGSVNERSSNGSGISGEDLIGRDVEDGKGRKKKVKKSKSFLQKHGNKIKAKLSFGRRGDQNKKVRKKVVCNEEMVKHVDTRSKNLLDVKDYNNVMTHVRMYKDKEVDVEGLVNSLLLTLDSPRKAILLRDIRAIVVPYDVGRFDAMTSNREVEALEFYGNKAPVSPVLDDNAVQAKPKKTLVEAVQDSHGNFQLRTRSEAELIKRPEKN